MVFGLGKKLFSPSTTTPVRTVIAEKITKVFSGFTSLTPGTSRFSVQGPRSASLFEAEVDPRSKKGAGGF